MCFPVNFTKALGTPNLQNACEELFPSSTNTKWLPLKGWESTIIYGFFTIQKSL